MKLALFSDIHIPGSFSVRNFFDKRIFGFANSRFFRARYRMECIPVAVSCILEEKPDLIVATSMGAMYAEQLTGIPRILVNPSFHMARLLTFRGMGKREFRNKRLDGAKDFRVDKQMIQEFTQVEKSSFSNVDATEKTLVWGLFGMQDKLVNCQEDFRKHYGSSHMRLFDGEHYLNDKVLSREVIPLIETLLEINNKK